MRLYPFRKLDPWILPFLIAVGALFVISLGTVGVKSFREYARVPTPTPILPTQTPEPSHTPTTAKTNVPLVTKATTIDCVGPDGKHLSLTQKACDEFNGAWHPSATPTPTIDIKSKLHGLSPEAQQMKEKLPYLYLTQYPTPNIPGL